MQFVWIIVGIFIVLFLVLTIYALREYGQRNVSEHPKNLEGMPPELKEDVGEPINNHR
jgi:hypothetical protein